MAKEIKYPAHVGMGHTFCQKHFAFEALQTVGITGCYLGPNHFEGHGFVGFEILCRSHKGLHTCCNVTWRTSIFTLAPGCGFFDRLKVVWKMDAPADRE